MAWTFSGNRPIFQQLKEIIILKIINSEYKTGDKLPPVRDIALEAGVNPNTVQRAMAEIEGEGIIYTKRGDGRYVSEDEDLISAVKSDCVNQMANDFVQSLKSLGLDSSQIKTTLEEILKTE